MNVVPANIPDVLILEPKVVGDERGFFCENYNERVLTECTGLNWVANMLFAVNKWMLWISLGFAHGFLATIGQEKNSP